MEEERGENEGVRLHGRPRSTHIYIRLPRLCSPVRFSDLPTGTFRAMSKNNSSNVPSTVPDGDTLNMQQAELRVRTT